MNTVSIITVLFALWLLRGTLPPTKVKADSAEVNCKESPDDDHCQVTWISIRPASRTRAATQVHINEGARPFGGHDFSYEASDEKFQPEPDDDEPEVLDANGEDFKEFEIEEDFTA